MPIVVENGIDIGNGITITSGSGGGGGGNVVTSGLQVQLRPDSYVGTGNVWNDTQGNANATLFNNPTHSSTGFYFDGLAQYATIPSVNNITSFDNQGSYTIEVWFRADTVQNWPFSTLISKSAWPSTTVPQTYYFLYHGNPLDLPIEVRSGMTSVNTTYYGQQRTNVSENVWTQVVAVYNYTNQAISTTPALRIANYKNTTLSTGDLLSSLNNNGTITNNNPVSIANYPDYVPMPYNPAASGPYKGSIGIIRIYNKGLTIQEITQNFEADRGIFGI